MKVADRGAPSGWDDLRVVDEVAHVVIDDVEVEDGIILS